MKRPAGEGTAQGRRRGRVVLRLFTPFGVWGRRPQRRLRPAGRRPYGVYTRVLSVLSMRPFRTLRLGGRLDRKRRLWARWCGLAVVLLLPLERGRFRDGVEPRRGGP